MNLAEILRHGRQNYPNAVALHHGRHHLAYAQIFRDVENIAMHLVRSGIRPGQTVAIDIQPPISHWLVLLALMRIGAVTVSLTSRFGEEIATLPHISAVVTGASTKHSYDPGLTHVHIGADWLREPTDMNAGLPSPEEAATTVGRIAFTSGTSGRPRAIFLDADRLRQRLAGTAERTLIDTRSVLWCGLGPDTAYGFTATLAAFLAGAAIVFSDGGSGSYRGMVDQHVNLILASPAALDALLRDAHAGDLPRLRAVAIVAGGRLTKQMRDALRRRICSPVMIAFGSSEAGGISLGDSDGLDRHPGHVGLVFEDVAVRIVDANGADLPPGEIGFLKVRSNSLAPGYLNDGAATQDCFEDGWFASGDLAVLSGDRTLTVTGRASDVFNFGGVKVPAEEIDGALREFGTVLDACAVPLPNDVSGAQFGLVIVGELPPLEDLGAHLRSRWPTLPRFLVSRAQQIARNPMGKINRSALGVMVETARLDTQSSEVAAAIAVVGLA